MVHWLALLWLAEAIIFVWLTSSMADSPIVEAYSEAAGA
ncbi:MAG: hypothetical protein H6R15_3566 [Proteobacteria bacterium]|nr:hypothetical protein [Pseudomonadota bacterium]